MEYPSGVSAQIEILELGIAACDMHMFFSYPLDTLQARGRLGLRHCLGLFWRTIQTGSGYLVGHGLKVLFAHA
jgi:hypothetical protein